MKYPKYEKYKDTGIEWLGFVPVEWKLKRLKFLTIESLKYGANVAAELDDPDLPRYVRITDVDSNGNLKDDTFRSIEKDVALPYLLKNGDLLFARSGATVGKTFIYNESWGEAAYAGYLIKASLKINEINPKLIYYYTKSHAYSKWIESITIQSTIQNVSAEKYASLWFTIPSSHGEQQSIANFLDRETARIDTLIEKKQKFIETLKEKRIAIISRAVTKGLNPEVPLKDSGIEWVDSIPANWKTMKLKWFSVIYSGGTPDKAIEEYWEDGIIPWINSGEVNQKLIKSPSTYITEEAFKKSSAKWIRKGDLVMALAGQGKTKGMVAQLDFDTTCNQSMGAICPNGRVNNRYILYWFELNYQNIRNIGGGNQRDGLNLSMVGNIKCPIPPLEEQDSIVNFIDSREDFYFDLIIKTETAIDKLKEYKTALISAAVTGKIKVA
jgi:type I restriction enzyme S subunit